ncbi:MAG: PAS domain-containing protein, partial [Acidimicrobiales bacterium]|nr:PAS domain-containing protein [Acidimicrobiales bacterium]
WDAAQRRSVLEELAASHLDAEGLDPSFQRVDLPTDATAMGLTPIKPSQSSDHRPIDRVSGDQHARVFALIGAARRTGYATGEFFFVDVERSMPLHVVDMTVEWGVMIFVRGGESANTRTDSRPGLAPRPRRLLMRRDASAVFVWVDDNTTTLLGWTNDDLLGTPATKLIHPDDLDRAVEGWLSMLGGADSEPTRLRYRDVSGASAGSRFTTPAT